MVPLIFLLTYLGVAMGRYPRLALDRTGIALLGALAMATNLGSASTLIGNPQSMLIEKQKGATYARPS